MISLFNDTACSSKPGVTKTTSYIELRWPVLGDPTSHSTPVETLAALEHYSTQYDYTQSDGLRCSSERHPDRPMVRDLIVREPIGDAPLRKTLVQGLRDDDPRGKTPKSD